MPQTPGGHLHPLEAQKPMLLHIFPWWVGHGTLQLLPVYPSMHVAQLCVIFQNPFDVSKKQLQVAVESQTPCPVHGWLFSPGHSRLHTEPRYIGSQVQTPSQHRPWPEHGLPSTMAGQGIVQLVLLNARTHRSHPFPPQNPTVLLLSQMHCPSVALHHPWLWHQVPFGERPQNSSLALEKSSVTFG